MKSGCAIDVMPFIVEIVTKWISVMIVVKLSVHLAVLCCRANSVGVVCARSVPRLVDGTFCHVYEHCVEGKKLL